MVTEGEIPSIQVVPAAGCMVCLLLWLSPAARVLQARRENSLGVSISSGISATSTISEMLVHLPVLCKPTTTLAKSSITSDTHTPCWLAT